MISPWACRSPKTTLTKRALNPVLNGRMFQAVSAAGLCLYESRGFIALASCTGGSVELYMKVLINAAWTQGIKIRQPDSRVSLHSVRLRISWAYENHPFSFQCQLMSLLVKEEVWTFPLLEMLSQLAESTVLFLPAKVCFYIMGHLWNLVASVRRYPPFKPDLQKILAFVCIVGEVNGLAPKGKLLFLQELLEISTSPAHPCKT